MNEGGRSRISSLSNLQLADEDNIDDVTISVQHGLRHGSLVIPDSRDFFTVADLSGGQVIYVHDGSNSLTDNIIFKASDGRNDVCTTKLIQTVSSLFVKGDLD